MNLTCLPALRPDLQLSSAGESLDGAPQWTLADPVAGRYYKLNSAAIRLLRHWALYEPQQVLSAANQEPGLPLQPSDLESLLRFLQVHDLISAEDATQRASYVPKATALHSSWWKQILHQYLFFRIPLWRPDPFLNRTWPLLQRYGWPLLRFGFPLWLLAGLFLVSRDWERYRSSFSHLFSLEGFVAYGIVLILAKFIHELGHAYMAKRAGCRVQSMGVAFIVMFPLFYTDVSDAWRLQDHKARLLIGAGGILAEMVIASVALLAWAVLPEGPLHSAAFLLSSATWITTLVVNLNPLMRFDGYFMLSDALRVDNLQGRAYALCRWYLRERLFGYNEAPPENWSPRIRYRLLLWGYASWIWRFLLFFGIALTVYHYFFKVLGIFLMLVEISWFISLPIVRELITWWNHRHHSQAFAVLRSGLFLGLILGVLFVPWRSNIEIPAMLEAAQVSTSYAPIAAQVRQIYVKDGQQVAAGELLMELASPDLDYRQSIVRQQIGVLQLQLHRQAVRRETVGDNAIIEQQLAESLAEYRGLASQRARLFIHAPQAGRVRDLASDLTAGRWISTDLPLLRVVEIGNGRIRGYLREDYLHRITAGDQGRFIADDPAWPVIPVQVQSIDPTGVASLQLEALASDRSGPIAVRRDEQRRPQPIQAYYGVRLNIIPGAKLPTQPLRGVVIAEGATESIVGGMWRHIAALGVRESGF